ncbi:hypothetical protein MPER_11893 [Moniliophthora perniciosa FA553]|nr:hypothetical protein MPER_11893 [Moniliophthora perniciosa FA553]
MNNPHHILLLQSHGAPSCGRSYHLVATGSRDGRVRIWKVKPAPDLDGDDDEVDTSEETAWSATLVADHNDQESSVGRVDWNITGTVLSSARNDGRIRLWKASVGGSIWRPAGTIGVEQGEHENDHGDVAMQS